MTKETDLPRGGGQSSQNSPFGVGRQESQLSSLTSGYRTLLSTRKQRSLEPPWKGFRFGDRQAMMQVPSTRKGLSSRSFSIKILE